MPSSNLEGFSILTESFFDIRLGNIITSNIPASIAKIGPPINGKAFPKIHAGAAITRHSKIPGNIILIFNILFSPFLFAFVLYSLSCSFSHSTVSFNVTAIGLVV